MYPNPTHVPVVALPSWPEALPLIAGLDQRGDLNLHFMRSARLVDALRNGECDCALLPPTALLENPDLRVIPGAGLIAMDHSPVERLFSKLPLKEIKRIQTSDRSAPIAPFVQVLFVTQGLRCPELINDDDGETLGATLSSGVQAPGGHDIAALWREQTGTPLVLGVWACRHDGPARHLRHVLGEAARCGEQTSAESVDHPQWYHYRMLSRESESIRTLHHLARQHAIAGANVESIVFC